MPSPLADKFQTEQIDVATRTALLTRKLWEQVDPSNITQTWFKLVPVVTTLVANGQLEVARSVDPFMAGLLGDIPAAGRIVPGALAGIAADGRPLANLLMYPAWSALSAVTRGLPVVQAMASGSALLQLLARTVVFDTVRQASVVGMGARPAVTSYIRVVHLPACKRCIVLAGREYSISTGFLRHPRCDCTMEPVTRHHRPKPTSPQDLFDGMSPEQRKATFGHDAAKAIEAGADVAQVVNAKRGLQTVTAYGKKIQTTTEGTTRRGFAGSRLQQFQRIDGQRYSSSRVPRLMPDQIMKLADDREHAIRLLHLHGYIA